MKPLRMLAVMPLGTALGDDESLARAILRYLDDHAFAARVGAAARIRAAAFDDRTYAANVIAAPRESVS